MPVYTYRREDGTTFDFKQSFNDAPLATDPQTGQKVVRVVQNTGVIFKGSGFYVNDSKSASKSALNGGKKAEAGAPSGSSESSGGESSSSKSTDAAPAPSATPSTVSQSAAD